MRLGLDFDNTLVSYDRLFYRFARERGLIPADVPSEKNAVRQCLREQGRETQWTRLQGEVYGEYILEAPPYPGMLDVLKKLSSADTPIYIVSHKTRTPHVGRSVDLHDAARRWLVQHGFHDQAGLGWPTSRVFFELTADAKAARILDLGCTHYVDDLPEFLTVLPNDIGKILFAPGAGPAATGSWKVMTHWQQLPLLLNS